MGKVSLIIPVHNMGKTIGECLESVFENDYQNFEVIVVDDKSTDNTLEILESIKDKRLKYYSNQARSLTAFSRNVGIKNSDGDLIILLDADSLVEKDWIKRHVQAHRENETDLIGGGVVGIYKTIYGAADTFSSWWTSVPFSKDYYIKRFHFPTNNLSIKRSVFEKIGYFNEELGHGGEDAEFSFRALKNNLKLYFKSDIVVRHYDRDDLKGFLAHQAHCGKHAVKMRKGMKMDLSYLMPNSLLIAYLYILPLAILYTGFIILKWVRFRPSVLLYSPLIFLGKIKQTIEIKNSFK